MCVHPIFVCLRNESTLPSNLFFENDFLSTNATGLSKTITVPGWIPAVALTFAALLC